MFIQPQSDYFNNNSQVKVHSLLYSFHQYAEKDTMSVHTAWTRAHAFTQRDPRSHWGPSIIIRNKLLGCPGPPRSLSVPLSHLEAGVTLRAVRSSPPHCSCEDRFHRDKATHCSARSPFHQMCIITSPQPSLPLTLTFTISLHTYFPCLWWLRLKAFIVAFLLA